MDQHSVVPAPAPRWLVERAGSRYRVRNSVTGVRFYCGSKREAMTLARNKARGL